MANMHLYPLHLPPPKSIIQRENHSESPHPYHHNSFKANMQGSGPESGASSVYTQRRQFCFVGSCIQSFRGVGVCVGRELRTEKGGETSLFG